MASVGTDEAIELLRELAEEGPVVQGYTGDVYCHYCGCDEDADHEPHCLWLRAVNLVKGLADPE